ncbi:MAG: nucleotide sugar dehydrogenase [Desulfurella sp.]|jgi:UDP-N-acetyl-D-galactosamine dehydrogenase|uniref:UDP-N-acetyl-D-galactosamine dehydrogenase n=1 Tax=Desulfurella multipotens TaxID=79269 RepID=A0A1G6IT18_9BACT|nr:MULTISPECIES: nucleotide sugar dehydrogenase [Desulfurella]PMP68170.1 MAG: nucleotide sugar dehydrogenase [Desulfurella multipotens]PMP93691.1 MAG: nucleotide sugar dehydrogenase [Desulfurella sp.]SDC09639.1 UDP-N-acetyl-D-galactosamine dehydrogenase [Desulfurella multipotens]HEX13141.1 nucleotide sugar dehydrogenase [Desulfurella acetivorans]
MTIEEFEKKQKKIAVVGLGYVGLPLAVSLAKYFSVIGFDINKKRIDELNKGFDITGETDSSSIKSPNIFYTNDASFLKESSVIIVTVPTPILKSKLPDLSLVESASYIVGKNLAKGSIVVYESTVYPGVTEDICVPILQKTSGLSYLNDFFVGYSPERINPGDRLHTLENITKVVSASNEESLEILSKIYGKITNVYKAPNIKTAEAAKVIENTQRDLNIALMNELSLIFHKMGLDTKEVLDAAATKWNFLKFEPGLVGGHCISVDPYYLTYKAQELGYLPQVILAGRRLNDSMGCYIAQESVKLIMQKNLGHNCLILGFTFKENIKDTRNSLVFDIYRELRNFNMNVEVYDPHVIKEEVLSHYGNIALIDSPLLKQYDCVILAVKHDEFIKEKLWLKCLKDNSCLIDVKSVVDKKDLPDTVYLWRL